MSHVAYAIGSLHLLITSLHGEEDVIKISGVAIRPAMHWRSVRVQLPDRGRTKSILGEGTGTTLSAVLPAQVRYPVRCDLIFT